MTWTTVYLVCFWFGVVMSASSWLLMMLGGHLPHLHHAHPHFGRGAGHGRGAAHSTASAPSPLNFSTAMAFLAWFGGAGYLLTRTAVIWPLALAFSLTFGAAGAAVVFWFMAKVLWSPEENLDPDDFDVVGLLGTISSPIREGGTGEVIFQQHGVRRVSGARSDQGEAIGKGVEVVITRYDNGLAYVRTWEDMAADSPR